MVKKWWPPYLWIFNASLRHVGLPRGNVTKPQLKHQTTPFVISANKGATTPNLVILPNIQTWCSIAIGLGFHRANRYRAIETGYLHCREMGNERTYELRAIQIYGSFAHFWRLRQTSHDIILSLRSFSHLTLGQCKIIYVDFFRKKSYGHIQNINKSKIIYLYCCGCGCCWRLFKPSRWHCKN